jgi:shikimate dehydrogenase
LALAQAGASEVAVVNRTPERAAQAAALAEFAGWVVAPNEESVRSALAGVHLVVNATPVGMGGVEESAQTWLVPPALLAPEQLVVDLVYAPRPTRWLREAAAVGATTLDGLGMLVHQAAAQLRRWTDVEPPVEAMWRAAEAAEAT